MRTIEVNGGASPEEVRNFEFCCVGEVRMFSVLKHSCIVKFYGHQISSKWSVTEEGNSGVRALQSAILMEYIGGGSLKVMFFSYILTCLLHTIMSNINYCLKFSELCR